MVNRAPTSWTYEGKDKNANDETANIQIARPGDTLAHDVFGLCTLLPGVAADGKFEVRVHENNCVRELTRGHFQEVPSEALFNEQLNGSTNLIEDEKGPGEDPGTARDEAPAGNDAENGDAGSTPANTGDALPENAESTQNEEVGAGEAGVGVSPGPVDNVTDGNEVTGKSGANEEATAQAEAAAAAAQQLFDAVIQSMRNQAFEFCLQSEGMELVFYKRLVMMDTSGVHVESVKGSLAVSQVVREVAVSGHFYVVTRIYKPLLGWLAEATGIAADSDGEAHTSLLAKGPRMLGGNTGCFADDRDSLVVVLSNPKLGSLWTHARVSDLTATFNLEPSDTDVTDSLGADYRVFASAECARWPTEQHVNIGDSYPGGGLQLLDNALKTIANVGVNLRRRRAKAYQTLAEAASAKAAAQAAAQAEKEAKAANAAAAKATAAEKEKAAAAKAAAQRAAAARKKQAEKLSGRQPRVAARPVNYIDVQDDDHLSENEESEADSTPLRTDKRPKLPGALAPAAAAPAAAAPAAATLPTQPPQQPANTFISPNAFWPAHRTAYYQHVQQPVHAEQQPPLRAQMQATQPHCLPLYNERCGNEQYGKPLPPHGGLATGFCSLPEGPENLGPQYHQAAPQQQCPQNRFEDQRFDFDPQRRPRMPAGQFAEQFHGGHDGHGMQPWRGEQQSYRREPEGSYTTANGGCSMIGRGGCQQQPLYAARPQLAPIPMAAFEAKAAFEAQAKVEQLRTHAKYMLYCSRFPHMMQDPADYF